MGGYCRVSGDLVGTPSPPAARLLAQGNTLAERIAQRMEGSV
jgi:hypothetical protein